MSDNNKKNNPNQENSGGAKQGKDNKKEQNSPQGSNANPTTTSRGADSTDKEFRNNQPNPSTITDPKMKNKDKNN